ncbi:MAG: hypothetical protein KGL39_19330 [Patescibacteria group bacterium]|nr:hypothetical protein [Patescibacteria group bacterium]
MHTFDPYGTIHKERQRQRNIDVLKFSILWASIALLITIAGICYFSAQ